MSLPHPAVRSRASNGAARVRRTAEAAASRSAGRRPRRHCRHGAENAVVLVLLRQAPRRVDVVGLSAALGTSSRRLCRRSLQAARFLEAPMASLFHENSLSHPVRILASRPLAARPYGPGRPLTHCSGCGRHACPGAGQEPDLRRTLGSAPRRRMTSLRWVRPAAPGHGSGTVAPRDPLATVHVWPSRAPKRRGRPSGARA